jgi:hypothetical protein
MFESNSKQDALLATGAAGEPSSSSGGHGALQSVDGVTPVTRFASVDEAKANSKFRLIHSAGFDFEPVLEHHEFFFNENGERSTAKLEDLAKAEIVLENGNGNLFEFPEDDPAARALRLQAFESAAKRRIHTDLDIPSALIGDEEVEVTLQCSDIIGLPSTTAGDVYRGNVKVSLIHSKTNGSRISFDVTECTMEQSIDEHFHEYATARSCVACCFEFRIPCRETVASKVNMRYHANNTYKTQFFTLPVTPCLVDSSCYRSSINEFSATTSGAAAGGIREQRACCVMGCDDCCEWWRGLPMCCGYKRTEGERSVTFSFLEYFYLGRQEQRYDPVNGEDTEERDGVKWHISANNDDNVYVVLHYRSLLSNDNRTCTMRLQKTDTQGEQYANARRFVSLLGLNRNNDHWNYFLNRPGMSYSPLDMHYNELIANDHLTRRNVAMGAAAAGLTLFGYNIGALLGYCRYCSILTSCCPSNKKLIVMCPCLVPCAPCLFCCRDPIQKAVNSAAAFSFV